MRCGVMVPGMTLLSALLLAGCGSSEPLPTSSTAAPSEALADPVTPTGAPSEAPPPQGRAVNEENGLYQFAYAYPDAAAAIPPLRALLDRKLEKAKASLKAASREDQADAKTSDRPYNPHSDQTEWKVVANLPDFLSLSAQYYAYEGGAHGNTVFDALVWDRRANALRQPAAFFASKDALRAAIQPAFCEVLDRQRAEKRQAPVQRDSGDEFSACIDPVAETLILGSSNGHTFDRIGVLVAPYDAGPYAEGTYDVTVPVTGKVMAALLPQYRTAFSPASIPAGTEAGGSVSGGPISKAP